VLCVGSGPHEAAARAWIDRLPSDERAALHLLPRQDLETTTRLLAACDAMVMPGTIGLALVHGMAVGLPCVAARRTSELPTHESHYLVDGVNGLWLPDIEGALVAALLRLEREPEMRAALGAGASRYVREQLSPECQVRGFEAALDAVTAPRRPRSEPGPRPAAAAAAAA
jgi:glycosyltransferase involved in cell wall biosynthesis